MSILSDLLNRVKSIESGLQSGSLVRDVLVGRGNQILDLQKKQLFEGKASSGEDIRPFYSEDLKPDGYFYTVESAGRYAAWKQSLNYPYQANRNPDAPNLYIVGKFHSELGVDFGVDAVGIVPTTIFASGIMAKYGMNTFGLMMSNWLAIFVDDGAYNDLMNEIKSVLYVN